MPAIGSRTSSERGLQAAIKASAKTRVTPARKLPTPVRGSSAPPKQSVGTFHSGVPKQEPSFYAIRQKVPRSQVKAQRSSEKQTANKQLAELSREAAIGHVNPNLFKNISANRVQPEARPGPAPHHATLSLHTLGQGISAVEHAATKGVAFLKGNREGVGPFAKERIGVSPSESKRQSEKEAGVIVHGAEIAAPIGIGAGLKGAAGVAERLKALSTAERTGEAVSGVSAGTQAARVAGGAALSYGKLMAAATPAAALAETTHGAKKEKPSNWADRFYKDTVNTIASLPAATIEAIRRPEATAKAMASLYTNPADAFSKNSFGTLLAFLAPAAAADAAAGTAIRGLSGNRFLARDRASLVAEVGHPRGRDYAGGAVRQSTQRLTDVLKKREAVIRSGEKVGVKATKREAKKMVATGLIKPNQLDIIKGGERASQNIQTMKYHHFLEQHVGGHGTVHQDTKFGSPHDEAVMTFHEGVARRADTFWEDVANRVARLRVRGKNLSHQEARENDVQIKKLEYLEHHRNNLDEGELRHAERSAAAIAPEQAQGWRELNAEGVGEPHQLNARNYLAVLEHGHHLGRGDINFLKEPGKHPYYEQLKGHQQAAAAASREIQRLSHELKGGHYPKNPKSGKQFRIAELKLIRNTALEHANALRQKIDAMRFAGHIKPNGEQWPGLYDEAHNKVTHADIQKLLDQEFNGREMGFLTHKMQRERAPSQNQFGPRTMFKMRTGESGLNGTYDNSVYALRNHFDMIAHNLATMRGRRGVFDTLTVGKHLKSGEVVGFSDAAEAQKAADIRNNTAEGQVIQGHLGPWVPVHVGANKVAELMQHEPYGRMSEYLGHTEAHALSEEPGGWRIAPKKVAQRLDAWEHAERAIRSSPLRIATTPWRQTNLYTSVRWPFGTTQENAIRLMAHQVSPLVVLPKGKYTSVSFGTGSHITRMLDEKINDPAVPYEAKRLAVMHRALYGAGNFVGSQLHDLEPALRQIEHKTPWLFKLENAPVWSQYRHWVGNSLAKMETNAKTAAGGKLARQDQSFFDRWRRQSKEQAAKDYVEKLTTDPVKSIKEAEKLMDIMGNWNHLTPLTRRGQAEYAPFVLWWLNSAKFVFKTMPKDHPLATGLLAAMVTATGAENRDLKEYLTGDVPLDLPFIGKINLNPVHYSPFDIAHEAPKTAASMALPQVQEPVDYLKGTDPLTGEKIKGGEGVGPARAAEGLLGSFVPGVRLGQTIARSGGHQTGPFAFEAKSKKGLGQTIAKYLSPLMFTYQSPEQIEQGEEDAEEQKPSHRGGIVRKGPVAGKGAVSRRGPVAPKGPVP